MGARSHEKTQWKEAFAGGEVVTVHTAILARRLHDKKQKLFVSQLGEVRLKTV